MPPGDLIVQQLISQLVMETSWIYSAVHVIVKDGVQDGTVCTCVGLISSYFSFLSSALNLALTLELFQRLSKPMTAHYTTRVKFYCVLCHAIALIITLLMSLGKAAGINITGNCYLVIDPFNQYYYLALVPIFYVFFYMSLSFFILLYALTRILVLRKSRERSLLAFHLLYIAVGFGMDMCFPGYLLLIPVVLVEYLIKGHTVTHWTSEFWYTIYTKWAVTPTQETGIIVGGLAGVILVSIRLMSFRRFGGSQGVLVYNDMYTHIPNEVRGR